MTETIKKGKYEYQLSNKPGKKLMTVIEKDGKRKTIHFGGPPGSKHYKDKTNLLPKSQEHGDKKIRDAWRARHSKIKLKNGKRAIDDPLQPAWHSWRILW